MEMSHLKNLLVSSFLLYLICDINVFSFVIRSNMMRSTKISLTPKKSEISPIISIPNTDPNLSFDLGKIAFSLLPLSPESLGRRKTLLTEIVPDKVWTLDQLQGIINVNVPVRCTIVKLEEGGLWVNNPVAPTKECINFVRDLEKKYGPVKYIMLSTLGIEHKGTAGAFSSYFPKSSVWIQPGQYSFPIDLPTALFFPIGKKITLIPSNNKTAPWSTDFEHAVLGPLVPPGTGGYSETAFFHKSTKTLIVTDAIVRVPTDPPAIIQEDPRALLYHARDNMFQNITDSQLNRRIGWQRMVLFGLTFQPAGIEILDLGESIKMVKDVPPEMKKLGRGTIPISEGLYPWKWVESEKPSFQALQGGLLVAPILRYLIFNREPETVLDWVDTVCKWPFERIIPCHLENDIKAKPNDFRIAFSFLEEEPSTKEVFSFFTFNSIKNKRLPAALPKDCELLQNVSVSLTAQGVIKPESPRVPKRKR